MSRYSLSVNARHVSVVMLPCDLRRLTTRPLRVQKIVSQIRCVVIAK